MIAKLIALTVVLVSATTTVVMIALENDSDGWAIFAIAAAVFVWCYYFEEIALPRRRAVHHDDDEGDV